MIFGFGKKSIDLDKDGKREAIHAAMAKIVEKNFDKNIVDLGIFAGVHVDEKNKNKVVVSLTLPTHALLGRDQLEEQIKTAVQALVEDAEVALSIKSRVLPALGDGFNRLAIPGIQNVILVAAGKGGVGKSTVAANLAVALAKLGCKVGLLDADIYGPSVPTMFGIVEGTRPGTIPGSTPDKQLIAPLDRYGVRMMSIGFLVDTNTPMVWRGPMIASAAMQLFKDVYWGELDYLVVDMPPGTGDVQLTISQQVAVTGVVIVSTPQDVALADVVRAKAMFDKVSIPSLGLIENMSFFMCDGCGKRHEIFSHGGAREAAERMRTGFLGEIPIEPSVRAGGDDGTPVVELAPTSASSQAFLSAARAVATKLAKQAYDMQEGADDMGPTISISGTATTNSPKKGLPILN